MVQGRLLDDRHQPRVRGIGFPGEGLLEGGQAVEQQGVELFRSIGVDLAGLQRHDRRDLHGDLAVQPAEGGDQGATALAGAGASLLVGFGAADEFVHKRRQRRFRAGEQLPPGEHAGQHQAQFVRVDLGQVLPGKAEHLLGFRQDGGLFLADHVDVSLCGFVLGHLEPRWLGKVGWGERDRPLRRPPGRAG